MLVAYVRLAQAHRLALPEPLVVAGCRATSQPCGDGAAEVVSAGPRLSEQWELGPRASPASPEQGLLLPERQIDGVGQGLLSALAEVEAVVGRVSVGQVVIRASQG
jgi:hypothetical protein